MTRFLLKKCIKVAVFRWQHLDYEIITDTFHTNQYLTVSLAYFLPPYHNHPRGFNKCCLSVLLEYL